MLPELQYGLLNGWLPLVLYLVGFMISVFPFPKEVRDRLFEEPKYRMSVRTRIVRSLGQLGLLGYIGMMVFTPLQISEASFVVGVVIYFGGYIMVVVALNTFRTTPVGKPVVSGLYRWSRNPQWVGLVLLLIGATLMSGVLLYIGIILVVVVIYHLQILAEEKLCLEHYGDGYRAYMAKVPRYLLGI